MPNYLKKATCLTNQISHINLYQICYLHKAFLYLISLLLPYEATMSTETGVIKIDVTGELDYL